MFVTAFAAIFDKNSDSFLYINAGHNKPVTVSNDKAEFLECKPCIMLGVFDDARYVVNSAEFGNGDIICLYTDGVNEATNADDEFSATKDLCLPVKMPNRLQKVCVTEFMTL